MQHACNAAGKLMQPTCGQWTDCGIIDGGCCARGLHEGKPSFGTCNNCPHNPDRGKVTLTIGGILHGAIGIAKAITGTGGADEAMIASRTETCRTCDRAQVVGGAFDKCSICGCATWPKIRNASENCPLGKWTAITLRCQAMTERSANEITSNQPPQASVG